MKQLTFFRCATICSALFVLAIGCNDEAKEKSPEVAVESSTTPGMEADPAALKAEIQALETAWSKADDARDLNALAAFYSEDAVSMANNQPMLVGNAAIRKDMEASLAKRPKGTTTSYEVLDVFGGGNYATETGKVTRKDAAGKVMSTGKYMALWEKRNNKWICIRDIGNEDAKEK